MGALVYLWRAVDAEGEVPDVLVQSKRNKHAALKLMRKLLRKYAVVPERMVRDDLRSYGAATLDLGINHLHARTTRSTSRRSSSWTATASAGVLTRTSGPRDSGTFCPANPWRVRPPTTSKCAASAKVCSISTTAWCSCRMRCLGWRLSLPKSRPFPTASMTIKSTP